MRYLYHTKCYRIKLINDADRDDDDDDDDDNDNDDGRLHMYLPVNIIKYSRLSLSRIPRDSLKCFEISVV